MSQIFNLNIIIVIIQEKKYNSSKINNLLLIKIKNINFVNWHKSTNHLIWSILLTYYTIIIIMIIKF